MFKKCAASIVAFVLAAVLLCVPLNAAEAPESVYQDGSTGDMVVCIQLRLRELGYLCYRPTGAYRAMTTDAVKLFQTNCAASGVGLTVDGRCGSDTLSRLFDVNAPRVKIPDSVHIPRGPLSSPLKMTGEILEWSSVKLKLKVGNEYKITDCNTGEVFQLVFVGGTNHAEMEPARIADKGIFNKICGAEHNYLKRPVVVEIGGANIAASMQCYPHGVDMIDDNGIDGHICVFFAGSLSHIGSLPDVEHDAVVRSAAGR
ncbi:MAG: peptidoglycan-binding protein [Clostridia bacterium]|nr:peptidoglycan-binding protein [Clostridia bacterium]